MTTRLIECVPNISEGRDRAKIDAIAAVVETVDGVRLLDGDPGSSTHRTVITFVGPPETIVEAAFRLIQKAGELIDMSKHQGEHPRMGATDVCPFVPVAGVTMEDCKAAAHELGRRIGEELGIPVTSMRRPRRRPSAGTWPIAAKASTRGWRSYPRPDGLPISVRPNSTSAPGPPEPRPWVHGISLSRTTSTSTTSTRRANAVAFDLRENGRVKREGGLTGPVVNDADGNPMREPGLLKCVKGIGWYIEEYGIAQLSLNLTNISITTVHEAFDAA